MMGGDNDNVDDSGNANNIYASNKNRNTDGSEVNVSGDTYDDGAADENDVAIDNAAYTSDADNADVGYNANKDDTNDADNDHANDNTKDSNNIGMEEVPMPMMMRKGNIDRSILNNTYPV